MHNNSQYKMICLFFQDCIMMKFLTSRQLALLCFLVAKAKIFVTATTSIWLPTLYREDRFSVTSSIYTGCRNLQCAATKCGGDPLCQLFCEETDTFSFWYIYVDPFTDEQSTGSVKKCWTQGLRGNILTRSQGVKLYGTPVGEKNLFADNLLERFYYGNEASYRSETADNSYLLVDLGKMVEVKTVSVQGKRNLLGVTLEDFQQLQVSVGTVQQFGDFSSYKQIGYFEGPGTTMDILIFTANPPVTGRYVSFQRMKLGDKLSIGYVSIIPKLN